MDWKTLAVAALALGAVGWMTMKKGGDSGAKAAAEAGAKLVDVRSPGEFAEGHLPNAVNIPIDEVGRRLAEFGPKDGAIVVYCRSGARSARARQQLEAAGYSRVFNLGAMSNW